VTASVSRPRGGGAEPVRPPSKSGTVYKYVGLLPEDFKSELNACKQLTESRIWRDYRFTPLVRRSLKSHSFCKIIISLQTPPATAATYLTRVESLTVLGVTFNSKLRFDLRVSNIINKAARALYGLKTTLAHGLTGKSIHDVTRATLIVRVIWAYAAPVWWGFLTLAERDRIQSVIKKAQRYI